MKEFFVIGQEMSRLSDKDFCDLGFRVGLGFRAAQCRP